MDRDNDGDADNGGSGSDGGGSDIVTILKAISTKTTIKILNNHHYYH